MKSYFFLTLLLSSFMVVFPFVSKIPSNENIPTTISEQSITANENKSDKELKVFRTSSGQVIETDYFEYIVGVVAGEMPASFCDEALKAQAVASYTYAKWYSGDSNNDYITDSPSVHQCYIDSEEQKEKWGENYEKYRQKIESAVSSVFGQYLTYNNKAAMTVFHAISSGKTLSSEEVWGKHVPYLISAEGPGDKLSEKYETSVTITAEDFRRAFSERTEFASSAPSEWCTEIERKEEGYILSMKVGNKLFSARDIKKILDLPGICFKGKYKNENFIFTVHGRGHNVGMSQYSADYLARQGYTYREILNHFYPGTTLEYTDV